VASSEGDENTKQALPYLDSCGWTASLTAATVDCDSQILAIFRVPGSES
jgi:hypothetical protein